MNNDKIYPVTSEKVINAMEIIKVEHGKGFQCLGGMEEWDTVLNRMMVLVPVASNSEQPCTIQEKSFSGKGKYQSRSPNAGEYQVYLNHSGKI